ncbi:hypothetical protein CF386_09185 [Paraphotobacterium marinum]|uniref:Uncharacterized protein n=1 Tax=Paraphotobacterium marinum TaxID=1755811 RepID=A0A220VFS6_9GAMM|nr:hypothetical protein CF386_09185 [Paraphotobacterium marinum]
MCFFIKNLNILIYFFIPKFKNLVPRNRIDNLNPKDFIFSTNCCLIGTSDKTLIIIKYINFV